MSKGERYYQERMTQQSVNIYRILNISDYMDHCMGGSSVNVFTYKQSTYTLEGRDTLRSVRLSIFTRLNIVKKQYLFPFVTLAYHEDLE